MPSPRQFVIFEAAARLGSFTLAAKELSMQQPSVSAAIKQIEANLGITLFYRTHRHIRLTATGQRLYAGISTGLSSMEAAINAAKDIASHDHVTLSTSSAFSYYWMMPRLQHLHDIYPAIDLRLQNSDREPDLDVENISLAIRLGDGDWPGYHSFKLADEILYPVASPRVMAAAPDVRSVPNLLNQRLIHLEEPIRERPTWSDWFVHHNIKTIALQGGLRLNDYALVLQAAISGEGFAIGWDHIVRDMIEKGVLAGHQKWSWQT
ncbi:MAG: LysR substrate-binding domain-containing protein, partial [Candidatus Puniceispirillaceae bacterium]